MVLHETGTNAPKSVNKMPTEIDEIRQKKLAEMMSKMKTGNDRSDGWPVEPVPVTDSSFEAVIKKFPRVVVDCWAPWCGPCRMLAPTIDAMARDHKGRIAFAKLNTDENFGTASKYKISSIPTLMFFKDGALVDKMIGAAPRSVLESKVKSVYS